MTTVDLRSSTSAPSTSRTSVSDLLADGDTDLYVGRHRRAGGRTLSIMRMLHRPRHRGR
jgi:hypothetical protein